MLTLFYCSVMSAELTSTTSDAQSEYGSGEFMYPEQRALKELVSMGVRYAVLRKPMAWEEAGDIDIVALDAKSLDEALRELNYVKLVWTPANCKYVRFDSILGQWIHLDVHTAISYGQVKAPRIFTKSLIDEATINADGIPCLNPIDELMLLIFHLAVDKGRFDSKYMSCLSDLDANLIDQYSDKYSFLPKPLAFYFEIIVAYRRGVTNGQETIAKIRSTFGPAIEANRSFGRRVMVRSGQLFLGTRPVVFLGPDGSGKSTLTLSLTGVRWPRVRRQYMGPGEACEVHRGVWRLRQLVERLRETFSKKHPIGIVARTMWHIVYYLDCLYRVWRHIWFRGSGGIVFFDRYACDMYFRKPTFWNELLFIKMFPSPLFVFLCVGDAKAVYQRKAEELSEADITNAIELYRKKLLQYRIPFVEIDTTNASLETNLQQVIGCLIENEWFRSKKKRY